MKIRLSQLRRIIREVAAAENTLHGDTSDEEAERDAALAAAGINPPRTPSGGSVPLATPHKYPASQPNRKNPLMGTNFGNTRDVEAERDAALRAVKGDIGLDEMTESILRAVIRASRRR